MTPNAVEELLRLRATSRFGLLAELLEQLHPGCLDDADRLPADATWLRPIVLVSLEGSGQFERAIGFAQRLAPAARIGDESPGDVVRRLVEIRRVLAGKMRTVLNQRGEVVTVLGDDLVQDDGGFQVEYKMDTVRIDKNRCLFALQRMRRKLIDRFGADAGRVEVEIHAEPARFQARAEAATGHLVPLGLRGLAVPAHNRILALHDPSDVGVWETVVTLSHEYVHLAMRTLTPTGRLPRWLDEGLAVTLTMDLSTDLLTLWERASGVGLRLGDMEDDFGGSGRAVDLAYARSAVAAQRILDEPNGDALLVRGLSEGWDTSRWEAETRLHGVC